MGERVLARAALAVLPGFLGLVVELGLRRSASLLSRLRGDTRFLTARRAGYGTRSLVAMIMLLQMLKVVRAV